MTLRMVQRLQRGKLPWFAVVVGLTSVLAVWLAVARDRAATGPGPSGAGNPGTSVFGAMPLATGDSMTCIPNSAHATGAAGTNWGTDMEVHNPGSIQANYSIALLKHGEDNSSPAGLSVTVAPGRAIRDNDVISDLCTGQGALDYTKPVVLEVWLTR
jgi:hypothetical protein